MKRVQTFVLSIALAFASAVFAQTLPATIKVLIPFPPGGPVDTIGRLVAEGLRTQLKNTVVPENRPGANGAVAVNVLKQSPPDGGTLLIVSSGMITFSPHFLKNLPYDPARDLAPIVSVAFADIGLVLAKKVPASNLRQFIELAKSSAKPLAMASAGTGNLTHAFIELLKDSAKVNFLHVPYKGASPALADLMGGQVDGMFIALATALPAAKAGKVKVTEKRPGARNPDHNRARLSGRRNTALVWRNGDARPISGDKKHAGRSRSTSVPDRRNKSKAALRWGYAIGSKRARIPEDDSDGK